MDCMRSYFKYQVTTRCGIPAITLEGSKEDWKKLREKVKTLVEMNRGDCLELNWWLRELVPVVNKICDTVIQNKVDKNFWSEIYKQKGGSGGPYVTGWINIFFPYIATGRNDFGSVATNKFPNQISKVPFIWDYYKERIPMIFYGGFIGAYFDKDKKIVKPGLFWSVNYA